MKSTTNYTANGKKPLGSIATPDSFQHTHGELHHNSLQNRIVEIMSKLSWDGSLSLGQWNQLVLNTLASSVNALQATLYMADSKQTHLHLMSTYSVPNPKKLTWKILFGDELVGTAAKLRQHKLIELPSVRSTSTATAGTTGGSLLIWPLSFNQTCCGVMELVHLHQFSKSDMEFLSAISGLISAQMLFLIKEMEQKVLLTKVRESEERLRQLTEVSTEGIAFTDRMGIITETNRAFENLLALSPGEAKGKSLQSFIPTINIAELELGIQGNSVETYLQRNDGLEAYAEVETRNINYHGRSLLVTTLRDITQRIKNRRKLLETEAELENAQRIVALKEQVDTQNRKLTASITYARRIQQAMLPPLNTIQEAFTESFVLFRPRDIVSGDFYWYTQQGDLQFVAIADCTGHGVPGAFMSMIGAELLSRIINEQHLYEPGLILSELDRYICENLHKESSEIRDGMDIALCVINRKESYLQFAGAKNPLCYTSDGNMQVLDGDRISIGGMTARQPVRFTTHRLDIKPRNTFYMWTDGYHDQFGGELNRKMGSRNFIGLLDRIHHLPLKEQNNMLNRHLDEWRGNSRQIDDILVMGFRI
jgi:PAS domain S-box-containing protein